MVGTGNAPFIWLDDHRAGTSALYENPRAVITIYRKDGLAHALAELQTHHEAGRYLAGYIAYEAGLALEPSLAALCPDISDTPLLQFGVFDDAPSDTSPNFDAFSAPIKNLTPDWSEDDYLARFDQVQNYIAAGDVYQINLTFPMRADYAGSAAALYYDLREKQPVHYGGVVSLGAGPDIVSLSPELFFDVKDRRITLRPMKGTLPRLSDAAADMAARDAMRDDPKSRAENLMIVDLLRNDVSRLAVPGSVNVPELFALESYPSLHQMTSTVRARLAQDTNITALMQALFPCGSVTGAPKIRAMEIIHDLEAGPRGAYCGAMGFIHPATEKSSGDMCFNVAIRTAILTDGALRYNVGSGVVYDSVGADEYAECLLKADILRPEKPGLIETFAKLADGSIPRLDAHLNRLTRSAKALGYGFDEAAARDLIASVPSPYDQRVRLHLSDKGTLSITASDRIGMPAPLRVAISQNPLTTDVQTTAHKVDARGFYDGERERVKEMCGADEVIFVNAGGAICEGSFTSIFIRRGNVYYTPPLSNGLLPGVLRAAMLADGTAVEAAVTVGDLQSDGFYLGNSLRGLMRAVLIANTPV